jgi:hypothetical protein
MSEWLREIERAAAEKVRIELAKPLAENAYDAGGDDTFDPWALFPSLYGTYSKAFDDMALLVLRNLQLAREDIYGELVPEELAHEMFREMLCTSELCTYGSSPRVCFTNEPFDELLPELIAKWEAYSNMMWGERRRHPCPSPTQVIG